MTHPEELLAGYVDGTLSASGAGRRRRAYRLVRAVPPGGDARGQRPVCAWIADRGSGSVGRRRPGASRKPPAHAQRQAVGTPRWYRFGGIAAAVAAALLVSRSPSRTSEPAPTRPAAREAPSEGRAARRSAPNGPSLARRRSRSNRRTSTTPLCPTSSASYARQDAGRSAAPTRVPLRAPRVQWNTRTDRQGARMPREVGPERGRATPSLIRARFQGTPAYLAVFLEGPGAGQPADTVTCGSSPRRTAGSSPSRPSCTPLVARPGNRRVFAPMGGLDTP